MKVFEPVKNNHLFYSILILLAAWHIATLIYNPLPWFDETFYASIAKSWSEGRGFLLNICPMQTHGKEMLYYGPVYFIITGLSFKLLGINAFSFRIITLLFTILTIFAVDLILKKSSVSVLVRRITIFILGFNNIIVLSSHSGRMDMAALFFTLMAFYFYLSSEKKYAVFRMVTFAVLALLTTPRIAVFLIPLFALAFYSFAKQKSWNKLLIFIFTPILLYSIWIFWGFGSWHNFISYYLNNEYIDTKNQTINTFYFIGGNFMVHYYQWPVIISSILGFILFAIKQNKKVLKSTLLFLVPVFFYYLMVFDTGRYSALVIPFWYIIFAILIQNLNKLKIPFFKSSNLKISLWALILFIHLALFSVKSLQVLGALPQHNPRPMKDWLAKHLPLHSKVVGDDRYFYACVERQSDLQYIYRINSPEERAQYHAKAFHPDYLLLCNETKQETIRAYQKLFVFEDTAHYVPPQRNVVFDKILKKLPSYITSSYEARLIKIKLKDAKR